MQQIVAEGITAQKVIIEYETIIIPVSCSQTLILAPCMTLLSVALYLSFMQDPRSLGLAT
jgi:hypothetical protein